MDVAARVRDRVIDQVLEEVHRHASTDANDHVYAMVRMGVFVPVSDHVYVQAHAQIDSNS